MKTIIGRAVASVFLLGAGSAWADDGAEIWSLHGQSTFVEQYHPAFPAPYRGANSLDAAAAGRETFDATLFLGARLWAGGEAYADPEIDQGFGLSNTLGIAGFPSGEAYKVGKASPYVRLQRLFFRQSFDLGGAAETVAPDQNQLGGSRSENHFTVTAGKISVTDIFDANAYAHDPKNDFMNWSIIDTGAYDYGSDAWGYSYGLAGEWTEDWWSLRAGLFDLSRMPNSTELTRGFGQYEAVAEAEARYALGGAPGKSKFLGYYNRGRMGSYRAALALGGVPDTALVRRPATRPGLGVNLEQQLTEKLGAFVRLGWNDGSEETYDFSDINRSVALGLSLKGDDWGRGDDVVGLAVAVNGISDSARRYLAAGGQGVLIGDGALPVYGSEDIIETYYKASLAPWLAVSADYQFIVNPAYSARRGPVSVLGARLHTQF